MNWQDWAIEFRRRRHALRLTCHDVARLVGRSHHAIQKLETGGYAKLPDWARDLQWPDSEGARAIRANRPPRKLGSGGRRPCPHCGTALNGGNHTESVCRLTATPAAGSVSITRQG